MKLTCVLTLLLTVTASAAVFSQQEMVTLSVKSASLSNVLMQIKDQTGVKILYNENALKNVSCKNLNLDHVLVEDALRLILRHTGFGYSLVDGVFVIKEMAMQEDEKRRERFLITGLVTDEYKNPLPGVTVLVREGKVVLGTSTAANGRYRLIVPGSLTEFSLSFSFVGMKTKVVKYSGKDTVNVVLEEALENVDEVIVTGYQNIDKRHLTSAVTSIKAEDILMPGMTTIDKMLEGHVPGMIFMQNSGQVGAAPRLRIRGTSTILGSQEPLWVVDGIIQTDPVNVDPSQINDLDFVNLLGNAISGLNPNDIDRIDVLKDASATALYGARAANGVIVITTKKGKAGPPSVSYSFAGSFSARSRYSDRAIHVMNSLERVDYSREIIEKGLSYPNLTSWVGYEGALMDYWEKRIDFAEFQKQVDRYETENTDWFDVLCRDAFSHNHTLSLSGGSEAMKYYASLGYSRENGVLKREHGDRYTANVKLTFNMNKFTGQFGLMGNVNEKRYTPSEVGLMGYAYNTSRAVPVYNEDGSLWYYNVARGSHSIPFNVLNDRDNSYQEMAGSTLTFTGMLGYSFTDDLKADFTFSYTTSNTNQETYLGEKTSYAGELRKVSNGFDQENKLLTLMPFGGELRENNTKNNNYTARVQLNYSKFVDEKQKHLVTLALGGELSSSKYTGLAQTHRCYLPERGKLISPVDLAGYPKFSEWLSTNPQARGVITDQLTNMVSGYGTLSYSYDNRYIFNVNMRIDASNKFGDQANDKLLPIWSFSGRWNTKEDVLKNVSWVNDLSIRASFGYQGNMLDTESPELIIKKGALNAVFQEYESSVKSFPNPFLKWEKTASFNTSMDIALFKNKLRGSVSYYYKKTTNAFLKKTVSVVNGVEEYTINRGTIENQGFELSVNFIPIDTKSSLAGGKRGFSWRIDPQIGQVLNKLIDKAIERKEQALHDDYTFEDYLSGNAQIAGRPLNSFYSYEFDGLRPDNGSPTFARVEESRFDEYANMSKERVFTTVMKYSGCRVPYIQGGISNTFSYRNFVLSVNLAYSLGSKVRLLQLYGNAFSQNRTAAPQPEENVRKEFVDRWRRPGDEKYTNIPGLLSNAAFQETFTPWWKDEAYRFADNIWQMYNNADIRVVTGNYLKIQNLSFRYSIPVEFCKKLSLQSAYLSLSGSNLYTWCHKALRGQDPTSQSGSADKISVPVQPSYTFNLNVTF